MSTKDLGITAKREENLSEWYTQVITKAEMADYSSAKGFMVLRPYGFAIWESIKEYFDRRIKKLGHRNAYFPLLIPERLLKREAEHFAGFTPDVFWVTRTGDNELSEKLAVRPTSETIIYESYSKWVKSWRDLPVLINVWNSVVRAEITGTRPFLRTSEFLWQEGHTVHATESEAENEVMTILEIYKQLVETQLAIPVLAGRKTEREKFKGAVYTMTLESIMPDGRAIQMGTSHHLGQNFSKPFEIKYLGTDEKEHFAWTTSWGISWRLIGAMVLAHGDNKGLIIPPRVAPTQVVLIPIFYKEARKEKILFETRHIAEELERLGVRASVDERAGYSPGWKYNEWEMKGVPVRVEIGPRDVEQNQVTVVRRDTGKKEAIGRADASTAIARILEEIQTLLFDRATRTLTELTSVAENKEALKRILDEKGGFIRSHLCDNGSCEEAIQRETGATVRLIAPDQSQKGKCIQCQADNSKLVYFARAY